MAQYLITVFDQPDTRTRPPEEMGPIYEAVGAVNQKMIDAGIFIFAGGLEDQAASTTVDARSGSPVVSDGPYLETKEYIGGFWIIDVADRAAALDWAQQASIACQQPLELRTFMAEPED